MRLAVASVRRHCPDLPILASCSNASSDLQRWLSERCEAGVYVDAQFDELTWNVKPKTLLWAVDHGHRQVLWLDADVVLSADFRSPLPPDDDVFVAAEEYGWGQVPASAAGTPASGLPPGRRLKRTVRRCLWMGAPHPS